MLLIIIYKNDFFRLNPNYQYPRNLKNLLGTIQIKKKFSRISYNLYYDASRDAAAQSVTVKAIGYGFDPHSRN